MNASCKSSIASEVHARHKRPHRLALLATSPVATGEARIEGPRKGTEHTTSLPCQSGGAVNVIQSHFADARVLGTFSHTTCYPISCA